MHIEAKNFTLFCKRSFPEFFNGKRVLDVGSGDINGNNRFLFEGCDYEGNDVYPAKNVTIVSKTSLLQFPDESFDVICSTECFEHDPEYSESLKKIIKMLKPGGLFFFTCASAGRAEHGTRRTTPRDSYGTIGNVEGWIDYYKNLTFEDLDSAIDVKSVFQIHSAYYNSYSKDLYFYGIKHGGANKYNLINYTAPSVVSKP
jgi:SAM-dependent methyltransferase